MQPIRDEARFWRNPLLPDVDMLTARYYAQKFAPHWHEEFVIPIIQGGAQSYRYRGTRYVAATGGIGAINPGEIHTGERACENGWAYRVFYPTVAWMQALASDIAGRQAGVPWLPGGVIEDTNVAAKLSAAHRLLETAGDPLLAETALVEAFSLLLRRHARSADAQTMHADDARLQTMKAKLSADLTEQLSLSQLAAAVDLSPFYATRLFSQSVGMPPHAWRNQLRLNRGQALLRRGVSATDVAAAVGFTDQSHFTRHFKRAFGVTPGRWGL